MLSEQLMLSAMQLLDADMGICRCMSTNTDKCAPHRMKWQAGCPRQTGGQRLGIFLKFFFLLIFATINILYAIS